MFNWLITGGTGSLGQALVKELLQRNDVHSIRIYSRGEYAQWQMREKFNDERLRFLIGDIRDRNRLDAVMLGVDYVIHTAALKHITTGETNPQEFIRTNCEGSVNVVDSAARREVKKVLGVSSDKAVYPLGLYGATKRIMESLFKESNRWSAPKTLFSCFRCGNYFQSNGNVFELWDKQACNTGVCTLTDDRMQRYFIDIDEAARIALECVEHMQGGEIFIPKMREYSLFELLQQRHPEAKFKIIGVRTNERLREPLWTDEEQPHLKERKGFYVL